LRQDKWLYLKLSIAESLGKTFIEFNNSVTEEEVILWSAYFTIKAERQKQEMDKAKRGRR
jgi:hypothetical protein